MQTKVVTKDQLDILVDAVKQGEVIAFPTETVFGLGIVYDSKIAMDRLKWAKQRPESKPFTLMVSDVSWIEQFADTKKDDWKIINRFMPGALTLIFNRKKEVDSRITNGYDTIGIRCPDDPFVLELISRVGKPLLVPSANISGMPAATSTQEVLDQLDGRISLVVDGVCGSSEASTIISLVEDRPVLIRQGKIQLSEIEEELK